MKDLRCMLKQKRLNKKKLIHKKDKNEALSHTTVGHTNCNNLVLSLSALLYRIASNQILIKISRYVVMLVCVPWLRIRTGCS